MIPQAVLGFNAHRRGLWLRLRLWNTLRQYDLAHKKPAQEFDQGRGQVHILVKECEVRRIVWDDLSEHLKQFSSGTQIIKELERLLMAA